MCIRFLPPNVFGCAYSCVYMCVRVCIFFFADVTVCVCVCMSTFLHVQTNLYKCERCVRIFPSPDVFVCVSLCVHLSPHVSVYTCTCVCAHVCAYMCVHGCICLSANVFICACVCLFFLCKVDWVSKTFVRTTGLKEEKVTRFPRIVQH